MPECSVPVKLCKLMKSVEHGKLLCVAGFQQDAKFPKIQALPVLIIFIFWGLVSTRVMATQGVFVKKNKKSRSHGKVADRG